MILLPFNLDSVPLYRQVYNEIKKEILNGSLKSGSKLLSKRKLSTQLGISINTVDTAYTQLCAEGYIEAVPRSGYFVCQLDDYQFLNLTNSTKTLIENCNDKIIIDFSPDNVDHNSFCFNTWRNLMKECFDENDYTLLKRSDVQGDINLRRELVKFLHSSRGVNCSEHQIVIGVGTDNLLQLISCIFGNDKVVIIENPVYKKVYKTFRLLNHEIVPAEIDKNGIVIDQIKNIPNSIIYVTPSHQFPLSISMPIGRRIKLLNFANESSDCYIIEDDYDSEFRFSGKPLPSLQSIDKNGKVIYIGTFSKSIAPSLRISYMVLPESLILDYHEKCYAFSSSSFEQKILTRFINEGHFEKHLNKMRKLYKEKRQHLINELSIFSDSIKILGENAGHHLIIELKSDVDYLYKIALSSGIKVYPISDYYIGDMPKQYQNQILLGYAALTKQEISEGVKMLFEIWRL